MDADAISRITVCFVSHIDDIKKYLVRDVHGIILDVSWEYSLNVGFMAYHNSESSLVVEVISKQHLEQSLIELKESILSKINESFFSMEGWFLKVFRKIVCSQCRLVEEPDH